MSHTDYTDYTENASPFAPSGVDLKVAIARVGRPDGSRENSFRCGNSLRILRSLREKVIREISEICVR